MFFEVHLFGSVRANVLSYRLGEDKRSWFNKNKKTKKEILMRMNGKGYPVLLLT